MKISSRFSLGLLGLAGGLWIFKSPHATQNTDSFTFIIFWLASLYALSILGQFLAKKINQPAVLGELLMGLIFGNLFYFFQAPIIYILREGAEIFKIIPLLFQNQSLSDALQNSVQNAADLLPIQLALTGIQGADYLRLSYILDAVSHFGIMYLLFLVGLESSIEELKTTGKAAISVAISGVVIPIVLGFLVIGYFYQNDHLNSNLFIAAALSATSVGITARVLKDLKKNRTQEAKIILGAAMLDDILGLFILAVVTSLVVQGQVNMYNLAHIFLGTSVFFGLALILGPRFIIKLVPMVGFLKLWEAKLLIGSLFIMLLSWGASFLGLSTIVGAFMAGLVLNDDLFINHRDVAKSNVKIKHLIRPLQFLLTPLFFFTMGLQVKLETFFRFDVLGMALVLSAVAIVGKLAAGWFAGKKVNPWFIGVGMVPRGEVGLIFASLGRSLHVMNDQIFSSIVLMVVMTTVIVPPCLKMIVNRSRLANESNE